MAFVQLESWNAAPAPGGLPPFLARLPDSWTLSARRTAACAFSILVHILLLFYLIGRLADGTDPDPAAAKGAPAVFSLGMPAEALDRSGPPAGVRAAAPAASATAAVDLSAPADLPVPEWSMTRMRVLRPTAEPASGLASAGAGPGDGAGRNGVPALSQFVGFGDGIGGELLLDKAMLEAARRAAVRAFPDSSGMALVFLRVSPSGTVMSSVIKGGSRGVGLALSRELLGKKLFVVRSAISGSALVALPPLSLSAET